MASTLPLSLPIIDPRQSTVSTAAVPTAASLPACPRLAMIGMADGDRKRVGFVGALHPRLGQQEADHRLDLPLLGVARAGHRLLDQVRRILGDQQPAHCRRQQRHAARLPELQRRARVVVDEGLLDRRFLRHEAGDDAGDALEQLAQAIGEVIVGRRGDEPARHIAQAHAIAVDDAPAGAAQARIDADDACDGCPHGRTHSTNAIRCRARLAPGEFPLPSGNCRVFWDPLPQATDDRREALIDRICGRNFTGRLWF